MALQKMVMLVTLAFSLLLSGVEGGRRVLSTEEDLNLDEQLKTLRKPSVKTIKTEYGEIFDCIDTNKQPALDHPLLKNHKIQMSPSVLPRSKTEIKSSSRGIPIEIGLKDGGCPQGTVPIRKATKGDFITAKFHSDTNGREKIFDHAYETTKLGQYYGTQAAVNVWQPKVKGNQNSAAFVIVRDNLESDKHNSIRAGWAVSQSFYKDSRTHLHGAGTVDNFKNTGCDNLACPGFVQVAPDVPLGISIPHISTYDGDQYDITLTFYKEPKSKDWWLLVGDKKVGYASSLNWGGFVYNPSPKVDFWPPMGSGHMPGKGQGIKRAAYIINIKTVKVDGSLEDVNSRNIFDSKQCYICGHLDEPVSNYTMLYGGPGGIHC